MINRYEGVESGVCCQRSVKVLLLLSLVAKECKVIGEDQWILFCD